MSDDELSCDFILPSTTALSGSNDVASRRDLCGRDNVSPVKVGMPGTKNSFTAESLKNSRACCYFAPTSIHPSHGPFFFANRGRLSNYQKSAVLIISISACGRPYDLHSGWFFGKNRCSRCRRPVEIVHSTQISG
jgi:hypothetical protein